MIMGTLEDFNRRRGRFLRLELSLDGLPVTNTHITHINWSVMETIERVVRSATFDNMTVLRC